MLENTAKVRYRAEEKDNLYPENSFLCDIVIDMNSFGKNLELVVLYEEKLLELKYCVPYLSGITADTSTPGSKAYLHPES